MKFSIKYYSLLVLSLIQFLTSCSVSKEVRKRNRDIRGNWVLQTVVTEGTSGKPKDKIFNEAEFGCFIGSEWKFERGGKGNYMIVDKQQSCPQITRNIKWSISHPKGGQATIALIRLDEKNMAMDNNVASNLIITQLDDQTMKWRSDLMVNGQTASIFFNFMKSH